MLGYRHAFHAGNAADVLKHVVWVNTLHALQRKPGALFVMDTHAGAGRYDLTSPEARKVGEFKQGIAQLWGKDAPPPGVADYLACVKRMNPDGTLRLYPGSAELARQLLRPVDRLVLFEQHPSDHALLLRHYGGVARCRVNHGDGWTALKSHLPPTERRGAVLIDPSYELKADYRTAVNAVRDAHRRWATGVYLLWYPLLAGVETDRMLARLDASGIRRILGIELATAMPEDAVGLWGSGLAIINPPWQLDEALKQTLSWLRDALEIPPRAPWRVHWRVPE